MQRNPHCMNPAHYGVPHQLNPSCMSHNPYGAVQYGQATDQQVENLGNIIKCVMPIVLIGGAYLVYQELSQPKRARANPRLPKRIRKKQGKSKSEFHLKRTLGELKDARESLRHDYNNDRISYDVFSQVGTEIDDQMEQIEKSLGMYD